MIPFFMGGLTGYVGCLAVVVTLSEDFSAAPIWEEVPLPWWRVALLLVALPAFVQGLLGEASGRLLRKRTFDPRSRDRLRPFVAGLMVSVLAIAIVVFVLPFAMNRVSDPVAMIAATAIATLLGVSVMHRAKPGACFVCGYHLGGPGSAKRCPECGTRGIPSGAS